VRAVPLPDDYVIELMSVRQVTLAGLAAHDDEWLDWSVIPAPKTRIGLGSKPRKTTSIIADRFAGRARLPGRSP